MEKTVFVVYFSGEQAKTKILKICEAFGANFYPVPEDITKQRQITREVSIQKGVFVSTFSYFTQKLKSHRDILFNLYAWGFPILLEFCHSIPLCLNDLLTIF